MTFTKYIFLGAFYLGAAQAQQKIGDLDETIINANRFEEKKSDTSAAVSVIDAKRFEKLQPQSLDDVFRLEPNVEFSGGPRVTGEQIEIRGQGGNAVTVRIDGARQNFVSGHAGQRFFVDPLFLTSAEILRGAKSHLYGSGAAGIVNLRTFEPNDLLAADRLFGGKVHAGYQSGNDEQSYAGLFALGDERLSFLLGYVNRSSDDIRLGNGLDLAGSAIENDSYMAKLHYSPSEEHKFSFGFNYYEASDQNGANPQANVSQSNALVDRGLKYHQFTLNHAWNPMDNDLIDLQTTLYYNQTEQTRDYLATAGSNLNRTNEHTLETYGIDVSNRSLFSSFGADNTLISGMEYYYDQQKGTETRATFNANGIPGTSSGRPNADAENLAVFLENQAAFQNGLTLSAGLRYDYYKTDGRTSGQSGSQFSPHVEIRYDVAEGVAVFANYAHAFTTPTLNELYQEGSHFGVVPTSFGPPTYFEEVFVPNNQLKSENSQNIELGVDVNRDLADGRLETKLLGFYQKGEDTFDSEIVGTTLTPGFSGFAGPGTLTQAFRQSTNRDETTIYGVEFDMNYTTDQWYSRLAYSYLNGEDDKTGNALNTITGNKLYFETGYSPLENLTVGMNALFVGSRENKVTDTTLMTGGSDIYGLFVTWDYNESVNLTCGVNNLLDQEYERTNVNNTEAGRSFYLSASYSF